MGAKPLRIHGDLKPLEQYDVLEPTRSVGWSTPSSPSVQREKLEQDLELDMSCSLPGRGRFRVNVYFQRDALGAAFQFIPFVIRTTEELGLPPQVADFARLPRGLVLVTGPTGSGKSTTLAALIDVVNQRARGPHHDRGGPHRVPPPAQSGPS